MPFTLVATRHFERRARKFLRKHRDLKSAVKEIAEVSKLYGAQYYEVELEGSAFGYSVNHSAAVYLIQPDGGLRFIFPHATPPSVMLEAVRYLLAGN